MMARIRILIADDHEVVRKGIRTLLETHSEWEICGEACTGKDAIAKAARLKPDVVLLDITMPEASGLEAIPEILKAQPQAKIIVLTMHDSGQMASRVLAAGASGLVLKSAHRQNSLVPASESGHVQLGLRAAWRRRQLPGESRAG